MLSVRLPRSIARPLLMSAMLTLGALMPQASQAEEMPTSLAPVASAMPIAGTVSSPVTGISFADAPRLLPVDTRFSQAIQTIGFDVGLTCQQIEAYGWKTAPNEQTRVNNIFAQTADELARLGYAVQPQNPGSAAADITVYTATRGSGATAQNVLFTWSAGKAGLLLLLCDARGDVTKQGFGPAPGTVDYNGNAGANGSAAATAADSDLAALGKPTDIIGEWPGTYSCIGQGPAGATLTISRVRADKSGHAVSGMFSFYPLSDKNPSMVRGSYRVAGRYDPLTRRALLEPGAWIQRPAGFTSAPLIAEFDTIATPTARVSALFQGTTGCTSFEGNLRADSAERAASKAYDDEAPAKRAMTKKKAMKKAAVKAKAVPVETPVATTTETPTTDTAPADVPGSTAATSPEAATTAPTAPIAPAAETSATVVPAEPATPTTSAETPVTVPPAPPAAQ